MEDDIEKKLPENDGSIRSELSKMTFEELQKLKEKLGSKVYNEAMFGTKTTVKKEFKRANKNRPREVSSKIPPSKMSKLVNVKKKVVRDPRFDKLCGTYDEKIFKKSYSFLSDIRKGEKEQLKAHLDEETEPREIERIKYLIQRMDNQDKEDERKLKKQERENQEKEEQIQALKEGQKPYFRTKYEKKVVNLIDQYTDLKKSGKLKKHIEKHRKKNAIKDKKKRYFEMNSEPF